MKNLINILKFAVFGFCCSSCADLDIPSDGRVSLNEIFNRYERTSAYYTNCLGFIPQVGFTYESTNTPLASFCDEAHDASDNQDGPVSKWYKGYTTAEYNPLTASYIDPWSHYFQGIRRCNTFLECIRDPEIATYEFDEIEKCQSNGDWEKSGDILGDAAQGLEAAGADFILICTNTMHKVAPQIQSMIHIPIIHIADATAQELEKCQIRRVGLLGTKYTMTQEFYKQRLIDRGIEVMIPDLEDIDAVNDIIFHELCIGKIREESRKKFQNIIDSLKDKGADGVILGCTEIGLLIHQADSSLPVFDTTMIHAKRAVEIALNS